MTISQINHLTVKDSRVAEVNRQFGFFVGMRTIIPFLVSPKKKGVVLEI
jgi:hypothetical protein